MGERNRGAAQQGDEVFVVGAEGRLPREVPAQPVDDVAVPGTVQLLRVEEATQRAAGGIRVGEPEVQRFLQGAGPGDGFGGGGNRILGGGNRRRAAAWSVGCVSPA